MSFIVMVHVNEGIVMASDSRITITDREQVETGIGGNSTVIKETTVHFSDTTYKTFLMEERIGISTCGNATINGTPIAGYIETFIRENKGINVNEVPEKIYDYFNSLAPSKETIFFIAGYDTSSGISQQCIFKINTKKQKADAIISIDTSFSNAHWDGEKDVASRLITDLYIKNTDEQGNIDYTKHVQYKLAMMHWTLQDAIEFCQFLIATTINSMKFQKRKKTVGGPIDILVIKPEIAFWVSHKELHK